MRFTKMHGLGNDYIYVDASKEKVADPASLARAISHRHYGVGSDGLILILPSDRADVRMRMFNADGSEGEMCGNGVRCVAKYAFDHGLSKSNPMRVETGRGVLSLQLEVHAGKVQRVTVDMDEPMFGMQAVGAVQGAVGRNALFKKETDAAYALAYEIDGRHVEAHLVSMGNPHAVVFTDNVDAIDVLTHGPKLESYAGFPGRINVHFAQVVSPGHIKMRTWERGSGVTLACGTGACAVVAAAVLAKKSARRVKVTVPGGDLEIHWDETGNHVFMTGPAVEIFSGDWPA